MLDNNGTEQLPIVQKGVQNQESICRWPPQAATMCTHTPRKGGDVAGMQGSGPQKAGGVTALNNKVIMLVRQPEGGESRHVLLMTSTDGHSAHAY